MKSWSGSSYENLHWENCLKGRYYTFAVNANISDIICMEGSGGKMYVFLTINSFKISFWMVPAIWSMLTPYKNKKSVAHNLRNKTAGDKTFCLLLIKCEGEKYNKNLTNHRFIIKMGLARSMVRLSDLSTAEKSQLQCIWYDSHPYTEWRNNSLFLYIFSSIQY